MYDPPVASLNPARLTPFIVDVPSVYPAASAATVTVITVPILAVPPVTVAELTDGAFASIVKALVSVRVVKAVFVLPAVSVRTMLIGVAPAALSVFPAATV